MRGIPGIGPSDSLRYDKRNLHHRWYINWQSSPCIRNHLLIRTSTSKCNKDDKRALLSIKSAFNNVYHFASWISASACCGWYGIDCDPGVPGAARRLVFNNINLSGDLPRELGVPEWSVIDLSRNKLTGNASFLFGAEKATGRIDLSRNEFAFDLSKVAFPVNLTSLDLNHNEIPGTIPAQINQVDPNFFWKFNN
ncbi:Polygalacturonase inhibitor [Platanthera zijinensis]|uniref:Polygalacturonase inhibitor n=1 Tax=Platanthera zijinensis TaxID=2320716 RepID=A0AAP0G3H4_9ASPA